MERRRGAGGAVVELLRNSTGRLAAVALPHWDPVQATIIRQVHHMNDCFQAEAHIHPSSIAEAASLQLAGSGGAGAHRRLLCVHLLLFDTLSVATGVLRAARTP